MIGPTEHDNETTSYDDDTLLQPATRTAYRRLLKQGWIDSVCDLHPDKTIYTFWDYLWKRGARDAGPRIDHLLLSPDLRPRLQAAGVDKWVRGEVGVNLGLQVACLCISWVPTCDFGQLA